MILQSEIENQQSNIGQAPAAACCPRCGYSLNSITGSSCPECGLDQVIRRAEFVDAHYSPALHVYACLLAIATFVLLILGGTVTSKGVGLSVPDWPRTFGHNMFLFPPSLWQGGIFWQHSHRLMGSLVGMLCLGLLGAAWFYRRRMAWLLPTSLGSRALVVVQGIMGGLRVTEISLSLAVIHGIAAQVFFCASIYVVARSNKWWVMTSINAPVAVQNRLRAPLRMAWALLAVLLVQLSLGAIMRHSGAGLAIWDFPTSQGKAIPSFSKTEIEAAVNVLPIDHDISRQHNSNGQIFVYPTPAQVAVAFAHRAWAVVVVIFTLVLIAMVGKRAQGESSLTLPAVGLLVLLAGQAMLGAVVIWSGRHPEVATAHQTLGALVLGVAWFLTLRLQLLGANSAPDSFVSHSKVQQV